MNLFRFLPLLLSPSFPNLAACIAVPTAELSLQTERTTAKLTPLQAGNLPPDPFISIIYSGLNYMESKYPQAYDFVYLRLTCLNFPRIKDISMTFQSKIATRTHLWIEWTNNAEDDYTWSADWWTGPFPGRSGISSASVAIDMADVYLSFRGSYEAAMAFNPNPYGWRVLEVARKGTTEAADTYYLFANPWSGQIYLNLRTGKWEKGWSSSQGTPISE